MVDTLALGASEATHEGSSPFSPTIVLNKYYPAITPDFKLIYVTETHRLLASEIDFDGNRCIMGAI
jgi:hypothetical protein